MFYDNQKEDAGGKMKRNVMIFSGGSYPGIEIYFALKYSMLFHPIMASSYSDHSRFVTEDFMENLPFTYENDFVEKFNKIIRDRNIEFVIPTHDTIAMVLMENKDRIDAVIVCSPKETTRLCRFKKKTYEKLKGCIFVPEIYHSIKENMNFPVFAKPDDGQGSVGAEKINNCDELKRALRREKIICEYLPGKEYTVDCFTNKNGELLFVNPRMRARVQYGISSRAENVDDETPFLKIAHEINRLIVFRGYWFIQLKEDSNGNLKLLELCTRFSGSFNHSQGYGINLPLLAVCDFAGMDVSVTKNNYKVAMDKTFIDRYELGYKYERVYIDYDDTITCENGKNINPLIMAFLYQCRNQGYEVILLTRHTVSKNNSLEKDMDRLGIMKSMFSSVIDMPWDDEKTNYINTDRPSIFIDNSFCERKKVSEIFQIPVFDVAHVFCLFDWRL